MCLRAQLKGRGRSMETLKLILKVSDVDLEKAVFYIFDVGVNRICISTDNDKDIAIKCCHL